jgi:antitoxin YefM
MSFLGREPKNNEEDKTADWRGKVERRKDTLRSRSNLDGTTTPADTCTCSCPSRRETCVKSITYSEARESLKSLLDGVCRDHEPVTITRRQGENVVVISQEDYESLLETEYLLSSRLNAQHLMESLEQARRGERVPLDEADL